MNENLFQRGVGKEPKPPRSVSCATLSCPHRGRLFIVGTPAPSILCVGTVWPPRTVVSRTRVSSIRVVSTLSTCTTPGTWRQTPIVKGHVGNFSIKSSSIICGSGRIIFQDVSQASVVTDTTVLCSRSTVGPPLLSSPSRPKLLL